MHPPHVSDAEIRAVIRELTAGRDLPSGATLRALLHARFGSRGGVARIYRLLAEEQVRMAPPATPVIPGGIESLTQELHATRERAVRAELREEAHQTRWAEEVDALRLKLQLLEPLAERAGVIQSANDRLRQQLQSAEQRVTALENQLLERDCREEEEGAR
jgi:hypothetical protein